MKRHHWLQTLKIILLSSFLIINVSCSSNRTINPTSMASTDLYAEEDALPTPAKQLEEIIRNISSDDPVIRLVSIRALENFGDEAVRAIPALRKTLFDPLSDIQINSAIQLGKLGPKAINAVPDLQTVLENDEFGYVRNWAAKSLGEIGSPGSVPVLAKAINDDDNFFAIASAEAIAKITAEHFRDSGYQGGYSSNEQGIPNIVIDARKWWQDIGQYQEWRGNKDTK